MEEKSITLKGKALVPFSHLREKFDGLGMSRIKSDQAKLELEKIESSDLRGNPHHFYRATFYPDKLVFAYSVGLEKSKRTIDSLFVLANLITLCEGAYEIGAEEMHRFLLPLLNDLKEILNSEPFATTQKFLELQEKHASLEKKYGDMAISSERNTRILLECEKKRDEYYERIKKLEGMGDDLLRQEIFIWLKTHAGELDISQFSKAFGIPPQRAEEGLEYLLKNGYIRKI